MSFLRDMPDYESAKQLATAILALRETSADHHGPRVAAIAVKLAKAAGNSPVEIELINTGAHLHDIGKVLTRKDLLNVPRKLSQEEQAEMRLHATYGHIIVEQAGFSPTICDIVRHHHERFDGNGYPDGLRGQDILLAARIVTICDFYEALVSERAYRPAYSPSFARNFMTAEGGQIFDPQLLALFFEKVLVD